MARPRKFDENLALNQAMNLFWKQGFERTSMADLVKATRLRPGSLYAAFENKQVLFLLTLDRYCDQLRDALESVLSASKPARASLEDFYGFLLEVCLTTPEGCFLVNTLFAADIENEKALNKVKSMFDEIERRFAALVYQAQEEGGVSKDKDPAMLARMMVCHIYGLRGYSKTEPNVSVLTALKQALMDSVFD